MRFGPRFDVACEPLVTVNGQQLLWVTSCRYLGVFLVASRYFKCSFENARKAFYRASNTVFGRVGRLASEEVVLKLLQSKCLPVILYGLDVCPLNASDKHTLDFVLTRTLMKIFKTGSNVIINAKISTKFKPCCSRALHPTLNDNIKLLVPGKNSTGNAHWFSTAIHISLECSRMHFVHKQCMALPVEFFPGTTIWYLLF